jgi:dipeptidyl aminopeptidase/acylaminoacyl peptidase
MRQMYLPLLVLVFALPAPAQAKHPFTFDDMMKLKRVGEPEVSPDGKWVIFSVVDVSLEANTKTPHIWIVPLAHGAADAKPALSAVEGSAPGRSPAGSSSAERILIADQDGDRPRWAPDGKRFAFLSTKEGGSQVWVAEFDSSQGTVSFPRRVTFLATEADGELWSPDGKYILFTSNLYPACDDTPEAEANCNEQKLKVAERSKVKAQIFDHLLYRHWNAYKEGKRSHLFVIPAEGPRFVKDYNGPHIDDHPRDLTPGDYDAPVFSLGGQDNYAFSPDGKEICYASNHDKNEAASTNNDLWIVPVSGGPAKNITADNPASDSTPLYSPDGRYIAYRAQQRPGYESDRFRLMLYDRKTGERKDLSGKFYNWMAVGAFAWATNSRTIFYVSESRGMAMIQQVEVSPNPGSPSCLSCESGPGGGPGPGMTGFTSTKRLEDGYDDDLAPTADGEHIAFTRMSIHAPTEIYVRSTSQESWPGTGRQLTHINDALLAMISMSPLDYFWFHGANNDWVEGFLVKPPNFDSSKKYPVKFLIHGGPQGAWGDDWSYRWNPELFAANGYVVVMINFHGSTGYGQKFIDAINGDWGGAPFEDLMKGLDYAEAHYGFIDKDRECALGASYGGYMANWILGHTDRFKCIVSHDGMFNAESAWGTTEELWFNDWEFKGTPYDNRAAYEKWSPHQYAKNFKTPTLVIHGQRDYRLDVSEGFQLFTTLQMEGVPSKMLYFPDEGHWVQKPQNSKLWYETVNAWVDQWTKK